MFNPTSPASVRILKFLVMETGTYNPMYLRPYTTHYNPTIENMLLSRVDQNNRVIKPSNLSGIASALISPTMQPVASCNIPNGWDTRRAKFMLLAEISLRGSVHQVKIQGFTSHFDQVNTGAIDPSIVFFINSYSKVANSTILTPSGIKNQSIVLESAHVVNGILINHLNNQPVISNRPTDIYSVIQSDALLNRDSYHDSYMDTSYLKVTDKRLMHSNDAFQSKRSNALPSSIVSDLVNSYITAVELSSFGNTEADLISTANGFMRPETSLNEYAFIRMLSSVSGDPNGVSFTFEQLTRLDPHLPAVSQFIKLNNLALYKVHKTGDTATWHQSNSKHIHACTILSNAICSLMADFYITEISFRATNHDIGGRNTVLVERAIDINGSDLSNVIELFKTRFVVEVMSDITFGSQELYSLSAHVQLIGDCRITISLGHEPPEEYVTPVFCDSLFLPTISNDLSIVQNNAHDFKTIFSSLTALPIPNSVDVSI